MRIRALKLHDENYGTQWKDDVEDRWVYDDFKRGTGEQHRRWRRAWISFDCALYEPSDDRVYLGITSFDADIFRAYDRRKEAFVDLGYRAIAHPYDAKFHRALEHGPDGCIYGAIALLHCVDHYLDAPGGALVKYDPKTASVRKLVIPVPHTYIQSIAVHPQRRVIYCLCFPPEKLVGFDLRTGVVRDYGLIGTGIGGMCQGENLCLDDSGRCWSSWQLTRAWQSGPGVDAQRLCYIDPVQDRIIFKQWGLPRPDGEYGTTRVEAFFNLNDGLMYASGANGSLFRFHPEHGDPQYLFTPIADRPSRLTSLVVGKEGCAYGIVGRAGQCELLQFDFRNNRYELLGPIRDSATGEALWQCHHLVLTPDGVLYACENDVPHRSGYLWEIAGANP